MSPTPETATAAAATEATETEADVQDSANDRADGPEAAGEAQASEEPPQEVSALMEDPILGPMLAPLSPDDPCGPSLRYDAVYDQLKELRRQDDPSLPQGVWKHEPKRAEWSEVEKIATDVLDTRSKDLQVAIWLLEAWLYREGLTGARRGIDLAYGLCARFWEGLHPTIDEDGDPAVRLAPVRWIADRLPDALKTVEVTSPRSDDAEPMGWLQLDEAQHLRRLAEVDPAAATKAEAEGHVTHTDFMTSATLTGGDFFAALIEQLDAITEALGRLDTLLDGRCGQEAPSFGQPRELIAEIRAFAAEQLDARGREPGEASGDPEAEGERAGAASPRSGAAGASVISSRVEAYQRLNEAAEFLLRAEPHSPVPYLVKKAVTWGNMPLADLLQELLSHGSDLKSLYKLLGIQHEPP